ncbi:MAG: hypothetical protein ACTS4Z_02535, partial [Candidatus Hodgkinia cicadicola]
MKCLNNLTLCYIERYVRRTLDKPQVVPLNSEAEKTSQTVDAINTMSQTVKLARTRTAETAKYELNWAKVVNGNNVVIGAVDVISTRTLIEGFEFEITSEAVIVRILTDKNKLAIANVTLRAIQNYKTEQVIIFDRKLNRIGIINDACRFEIIINKTDFSKIKTADVLRIEVSNLLRNDIISVEFKTQGLLTALTA